MSGARATFLTCKLFRRVGGARRDKGGNVAAFVWKNHSLSAESWRIGRVPESGCYNDVGATDSVM